VTCVSCQFRYTRVRGFCPMCGTQAPENDLGEEAARTGHSTPISIVRPREEESGARSRSPFPIVVVAAIISCVLLLLVFRTSKSGGSDSPPQAPASLSPLPKPPAAAAVSPVPDLPSPPAVEGFRPPALPARKRVDAANDPAELWRSVRKGNPDAEIRLAKLYLEGNTVAQNCEQAHLLLLAAMKRNSKAADNILSGLYERRCR